MNFIRRIFFKRVVRNVFESHGLLKENSRIVSRFWSDSFVIKNVKLKMDLDQMEDRILKLINDQPSANYNCIKVKNENIYISAENYFRHKKTNLTKSNLKSPALPFDFKHELKNSNIAYIVGSSGVGKTSLLIHLVDLIKDEYEVLLYSLKPEDFPEGACKNFEPQNLEELEKLLQKIKDSKEETMIKRVVVIDEFLFLGKISGTGENTQKLISDIAPFNRSTNFKVVLLSQSIGRQKIKNLDLELINFKLINLPSLKLYSDSLGFLPSKFYSIKLNRGQWIKMSLLEEPMIVTHTMK